MPETTVHQLRVTLSELPGMSSRCAREGLSWRTLPELVRPEAAAVVVLSAVAAPFMGFGPIAFSSAWVAGEASTVGALACSFARKNYQEARKQLLEKKESLPVATVQGVREFRANRSLLILEFPRLTKIGRLSEDEIAIPGSPSAFSQLKFGDRVQLVVEKE